MSCLGWWYSTKLLRGPQMDSCSGCALPPWCTARSHEVAKLTRLGKSIHWLWCSSFPYSWHQVDRLPGIHENRSISVVGLWSSSPPLDPTFLPFLSSSHQIQEEGGVRGEDRTRLPLIPCQVRTEPTAENYYWKRDQIKAKFIWQFYYKLQQQ